MNEAFVAAYAAGFLLGTAVSSMCFAALMLLTVYVIYRERVSYWASVVVVLLSTWTGYLVKYLLSSVDSDGVIAFVCGFVVAVCLSRRFLSLSWQRSIIVVLVQTVVILVMLFVFANEAKL